MMRFKRVCKRLIPLALVLALLVMAFPLGIVNQAEASPATIYVPDNYPTIQAAVDAASPGDTIIVRDGTYIENVDVTKSLVIRSENGADLAIVQAVNK
jgi:pectin methylesterase-like acyl-CoA thioesterase